jgi:hypothetical protein
MRKTDTSFAELTMFWVLFFSLLASMLGGLIGFA